MAEAVVDELEAIEVYEQHPERRFVAPGVHDHLGKAVAEQRPVRQAGQRVELGKECQPVLAADALQPCRQQIRRRVDEVHLLRRDRVGR